VTFLADRRTEGTRPAEVIDTTLNGVTFRAGRRTAAHLAWTDDGARRRGALLRVIQPCYNTGVGASAGTHDFDGVLDVEVEGMAWLDGQRFLREHGWAAWYRFPPTFGNHLHMVSLGCPGPVGVYVPGQVDDYYAHRNGLKGHDRDVTWHPADIDSTVFDYPAYEETRDMTPEQAKQLADTAQGVQDIHTRLDDIDKVLRRITKAKREVIAAVEGDDQ
jgi:hypothetical protein